MGQSIPKMVQLNQKPPRLPPPHASSSAAYRKRYHDEKQLYMAQSEIKKRTLNLIANIWWKYVPGTIVTVRWPRGWVVLDEHADGSTTSTESADPNDHYRPWLEANVGKQGWDWDWRIGPPAADNGHGLLGHDTLIIKMRKSKASLASIAALKWA